MTPIRRDPMGRRALAVILLIACMLLGARPSLAAALTAWVDRTTVTVGEGFGFVLSLTGGDGTQPPDLTPLSRDFDILDRRRASRNATVDGKRSQVNEWLLTLAPKRAGALTIPSLSVGGLSSQAIQIQATPLTKSSAPDQTETRTLFIQVEVGDVAPYVQSEIPVFVRIYDSLNMRSGSISRITADGATFTPRGDQESYTKTIGKTRYRVIEQGYTMVPQRSGAIEIEPVTLQANIPTPDPPNAAEMARLLGRGNAPMPWLDGALNRGRDVTLHSNAVTIQVKPRPTDAKGWFLPARAVKLTQAWSSPLSQAKTGDTLTRTITLEAAGASPNQLPPLTPAEADGVRQYEESSRSDNTVIGGQSGATLVKTMSVVLTRPGDVTLPAIEVGWWNTTTNTQEYARLPAVTFQVRPGPTAAAPEPVAAPVAATPAPVSVTPTPAPVAEPAPWIATLDWLRANAALAGMAGGGLLVAGMGLAWAWRRRRKPHPQAAAPARAARPAREPAPPLLSPAAAERDLMKACRSNDPAGAHRAYLAWERATADQGPALRGTAHSPDMQRALKDLQGHLYGTMSHKWDGGAFRTAFKAETKARRTSGKTMSGARLAPLYPEAR